ncbi:MAG TPA: hypothetical protein VK081_01370 [Planctomycetota bacterium]|nr:hypothetical protein [Planctomycetota bacterium]
MTPLLAGLAACGSGGGASPGGGGGGGGGPSVDLGTATLANYDARTRRVMQVVCLPLAEIDGIKAGDPITVLDPGTGQDERCQVEPNWLMPYRDGIQRCLRLTFPAVVASGPRTTFHFRRSADGALPGFRVRPNVDEGLRAVGLRFFVGPNSDRWVQVKAAGAPLPEPIFSGPRSRLYRWFARIYEPSHAPSLRTQMWCEVDIEVFDDEDYAEFSTRWGCCDPRIDEPNGFERGHLSLDDTRVGFDFETRSPTLCQPVPFFPEQCVVSLGHDGQRWRWVQDERQAYQGQILNDVLPWGIAAQARGVLLFRGTSGTTGDALRDASLQAFVDTPEPVLAIADTWGIRQEAYGPVGHLPRPFKKHEHYERTRDFEVVRTRLESEARTLLSGSSPTGKAFLWYKDNAQGLALHQQYGGSATGAHGSWQKAPLYPACAYSVPGIGLHVEKYMHAFAVPHAFREVDGRIVSAFDHPELDIDRLSPMRLNGRGDLLGKSALPAWRTNQTAWLIRAPSTIGTVAPPNEGTDCAHFEQPFPFAQAGIFGSRNMRRLAESLTYTAILGSWQPQPWNQGRTGQPRELQRGGIMHSWALWLFGADTRIADRCYDSLWSHYFAPAVEACNRSLGLPANRLVRTPNVIHPNPSAGQNRVELRFQPYFRPWEDALGVGAWYAIARLAAHLRPELEVWKTVAKDFATDTYRYGTPTEIDEHGRITFRYLRPAQNGAAGSVYEPGAAVAIGGGNGMRPLTRQEMLQNNWELCAMENGACTTSNDGYMRLGTPGAGTGSFTTAAASYILDLYGAVDDVMLTRYVQPLFVTRAGSPGGATPTYTWLTAEVRWTLAFEPIVFGAQRNRATSPVPRPSGFATARLPERSEHAFVVSEDDTTLYRVSIADGSITHRIQPDVRPDGGRWTGVQCVGTGGQDLVVLLDGHDAGFNRRSYKLAYASEQAPESGWRTLQFSFADGLARTCTGFAWDPNVNEWLVLARRPAQGNEGEASLWRLPLVGGTARRDTRTVIDVDRALRVDVLEDGRLMLITRNDGKLEPYAYARGGYWGSPRTQWTMPTGTAFACFTHHGRMDDALRVVLVGHGTAFVEVEI